MLVQLLFLSTIHYTLTLFAAFTFFAAGLLHLDSWQIHKHKSPLLVRSIGFFFLALDATFNATSIEIPLVVLGMQFFKTAGLGLILLSLVREPILQPLDKKKLALFAPLIPIIPFVPSVLTSSLVPLSAVLTLLISAVYFRKTSEGFEKQLKQAHFAFLFLGISEFLSIMFFWSQTPVAFWSKLLAPYGPLWIIYHLASFAGSLILGIWAWGYIRFRLQLQLFVSIVGLSLTLFLLTTIFYTSLLLKNQEEDALSHLKTDVSVLQYSLDTLKESTLANTKIIAQDDNVRQALLVNDKDQLYALTSDYMVSQKANTVLVASSSGEVVMRAENKDLTNDNQSSDPIVKSGLLGIEMATITYMQGVISPEVSVRAAVPIASTDGSKTIGVVVTGVVINNPFVDGVKKLTGLDVTVYGQEKKAATTFLAPDGKSRSIGTLEANKVILDKVLNRGEIYVGSAQVLNLPYYTAYAPLKDSEDKVVGMFFVGKLQDTLTKTSERTINLTFLGSIILMLLALIPAYFFARFLKQHAEV